MASFPSPEMDRAPMRSSSVGIDEKSTRYILGEEKPSEQGRVFIADDALTGNTVVVKEIDFEVHKYVFREGMLTMRLSHPGVIKMLDAYQLGKSLCLVYEYAPDKDLVDWIVRYHRSYQRATSVEPVARRITRNLVDALRYCHSRGVAHRDIKPDNIRINTRTLETVLIDFGMGLVDGSDGSTNSLGTLEYAAPEAINADRDLIRPFTLDIWSLGVVVFTVTHGERPYKVRDSGKRMFGWARIRFGFSKDFKSFVRGCMRVNPDDRLSIDELSSHDWIA